jgi:hypothetical protein
MAKKPAPTKAAAPAGKPSALLDTRVIYCGDCLEHLEKLPTGCIDPIRASAEAQRERTIGHQALPHVAALSPFSEDARAGAH